MVQLRVIGGRTIQIPLTIFQFLHGTIKRTTIQIFQRAYFEFQFLHDTIKRKVFIGEDMLVPGFNSYTVQLKVRLEIR